MLRPSSRTRLTALRREPVRLLGPFLDVGPFPRRPATDGPFRFGEPEVSLPPLVDGTPAHAEPLGDLQGAYGVGFHPGNCKDGLYNGQEASV
jgi:hypothetical protein